MSRIVPASDRSAVDVAVGALREGGLVCFPTDTVYGVGAAAGGDTGVRRLYAVKGRPPDKAMPLLLSDAGEAARVAQVTQTAKTLMARFWPGALTIVMRRQASYRSLALAGGDTVALRVPDHDLVRAIVRTLGEPVTGTSANRAGAPPPVTAAEAAFQIGEMVDVIIDGGRCEGRVESTIIDITTEQPALLREGAIGRADVEAALGSR